jgi:hypothetical protein
MDQAGMPVQQGPREDDQTQPTRTALGQQLGQRGQDRLVSPCQPRCLHRALEHSNLVARGEDLGVLAAVNRANRASQPNTRSAAR